jgi:hypothetical protein
MEGQIHALDRVQKKAEKFANLTNESNWKTLEQGREISARIVLLTERTAESGLGRLWMTDWKGHTV